ncbi:MAG: ABC transporter substrate-binding protein [Chloroflexi bacterium]|nr:ABC transporter substrate-binding protein [Chloroflexota bacterium]
MGTETLNMFRGFRWQLIALILALLLFLSGALFRLNRQSSQSKPISPTPAALVAMTSTNTALIDSPPTSAADAAQQAINQAPNISDPAYREGLVGAIRRLNPLFAHLNRVDQDISSLIFEGLFGTNEYGEIVPRLAERLVISSECIVYVAKLREDIRWLNGLPFSADDVIYTMSLLGDPAYGKISTVGEFWGTVEVQRLDDYLLRFRLAQPLSSFTHLLTIGILPEQALRGTAVTDLAQHPFNLSPIGTGPYQLAGLRLDSENSIASVELARSPVFLERQEAQGRYHLPRLSFRLFPSGEAAIAAYASGELSALANLASRGQLLTLPNSQVYTLTDSSVTMIIFNWKQSIFAERRLRQALSLSLDAPERIRMNLGAEFAYADSPYSPGSSVYRPNPFWLAHDLERALALLDAARIAPGDPGGESVPESDSGAAAVPGIRFSLLIEDSKPLRQLADDIASQWSRLGFQVDVEAVGANELANRLTTGRFDSAIATMRIGGDFDLYRYWHPAQLDNGRNYGAVSNHEIAELIEQARRETYSGRRALLQQNFQEAFAEEAIAIPLYYPLFTFIVGAEIEGIRLGYLTSPADRFRGIGDWRIAAR